MSSPEFIPESEPATVETPPLIADAASRGGRRPSQRHVAAILGIFLGFTGAHHFYLGSTGAGLALLATFCCGVGAIVGVVEGVMLLAMSDQEFEEKYVLREPESLEFVFQERSTGA